MSDLSSSLSCCGGKPGVGMGLGVVNIEMSLKILNLIFDAILCSSQTGLSWSIKFSSYSTKT